MAYQVCKRCILDSNMLNISFDAEGVCNFCNEYKKNEVSPTKEYYISKGKEFSGLLAKSSKSHKYDCICLYSGGKDSTYMLSELVRKYKLRVLSFTLDHGFMARQAFVNIGKVHSKLNCDSIIFRPSNELKTAVLRAGIFEYRRLESSQELAYMIGCVCWPCFVLIAMSAIKFAIEKKIPNLIIGTTPGQIRQKKYNLRAKYSGLPDVYNAMVVPMVKILKVSGNKKLAGELDLSFLDKLKVAKVKLLPFYEYNEYNEEKVIRTAKAEFGWEKPPETDSCSSNCLLNSLGIKLHRMKFNMSPYAIPFSRDIREGLIDREEALHAVNTAPDAGVINDIAQSLGIDLEKIGT